MSAGMRAGFGIGWKWVQQCEFLLYAESWVVQPLVEQMRPAP